MIALERPATPRLLRGERAEQARHEAAEFFQAETRERRQRRFDFDEREIVTAPEVIEAVWGISGGRCAFCGTVSKVLLPHRFRPPQDAVAADGGTSRRHYYWLAYEWENILPACEECSTAQGAKFPTERPRVRAGTMDQLDEREMPLLLDPCADEPERFLVYLDNGEVVSTTERGKATIETFDLNRPNLVRERDAVIDLTKESRRRAAEDIRAARYEQFLATFEDLYSTAAPLAAVRRQFFNQWILTRPRQVESILDVMTGGELTLVETASSLRRITNRRKSEAAAEFFGLDREVPVVAIDRRAVAMPESAAVARKLEPMAELRTAGRARRDDRLAYLDALEIRSIDIHNFRAIEKLRLDLPTGPREGSWLMLLGENGAGKSSVLQAIALALSDQETVEELELEPSYVLHQGAEEGFVRVRLTGSRRYRELRFGRGIDGVRVRGAPREGVLVAGYGATRLPRSEAEAEPSGPRIGSLFDPLTPLVQPDAWLKSLSSDEFDAVAAALRRLLDLGEHQTINRGRSGMEIAERKRRFRLAELSDGYKAMVVFALDMMQLFLQRWGSVDAAEGIVLVDEIGAHLHPRWQMRITGAMRDTFPRVQFVATTHDPLCLRGLRDGEVVVLRRNQRGRVFSVHDELPAVEGLAVDRLLTSEHFGLSSALDPRIEALFEQYYALRARRRRSRDEEESLAAAAAELDDLRLMGETRRERLALEAVDEVLAEERRREPPAAAELNAKAKRQVRAALEEVGAR